MLRLLLLLHEPLLLLLRGYAFIFGGFRIMILLVRETLLCLDEALLLLPRG